VRQIDQPVGFGRLHFYLGQRSIQPGLLQKQFFSAFVRSPVPAGAASRLNCA
jgi:hypothetical protein